MVVTCGELQSSANTSCGVLYFGKFNDKIDANLGLRLEIHFMLHYCKKCGRIILDSKTCDYCKSHTYPVPEKYWLDGLDFLISNEQEKLLREELVKTSPEFDQYLFEHRDEILAKQSAEFNAKMEHGKAILDEKNRVPKCPSCGSSNVSKIGVVGRAASFALVGFASSKIGKTYKCNHCGTAW